MRFQTFFAMYTKYYLLFPITLILGIVLGLVLPESIIDTIITPLSQIITNIVFYVTIPYFFFALIITTYELAAIQQFKDLVKTLFLTAFLLHIGIVIIGMTIFSFIPAENLIPLTRNIDSSYVFSLESILSTVFPHHWFQVFSSPTLMPLILLALIIGSFAQKTLPHNHVFLEFVEGMRSIIMKILQSMLPWLIICVAVLTTKRIKIFQTLEFLGSFIGIIIMLTCTTLALLFVLFPLLLRILKVPMHIKPWLRNLIPAISVAFASGTVIAAGGILVHVDMPNNPRRKMIDTVVSLSFICTRVGVSLVIALTYIVCYKAFSAVSLNILQFLLLLISSIGISFFAEAIALPIIVVGMATLSRIEFLSIQELYIIIIPLVPILMSFAAMIDALSCGFVQAYIKHTITKKHPTPFSMPQDNDTI